MIRVVHTRIDGIAEPLPAGESVLWSGRPDSWRFACRQFRLYWVAAWFAGLAAWRGIEAWQQGAGLADSVLRGLGQLPLAAAALALLAGLGVAMARSTTYALTPRRLVMNIGVALPITFNVPLRYVDAAELRERDGVADLLITLAPGSRARLAALWPHVRSWRDRDVRPMLRDVPQASMRMLAPLLTETLRSSEQEAALRGTPASLRAPAAASAAGTAGGLPREFAA